jgi:hypothetical protein
VEDLEVVVHLDGDPDSRVEGFFTAKIETLENRVKELEFDNAELVVANQKLYKRVEKLASRLPAWPKGYRPKRNNVRGKYESNSN